MDTSGRIGGEKVGKKPKRIREKAASKAFIPDEIIINILCRLPAKNVMQCRLVCKGWRDLTLDRDFVDLHFKRHSNIPLIMVANRRHNNTAVDYFLLDKWQELPTLTKLIIHNFHFDSDDVPYTCRALFSHAGLVVFKNYYFREGINLTNVIVGNPMDPENVSIITLSKEIWRSQIYGVFFHPSLKEYCSLWMIQESSKPSLGSWGHPQWITYKMLTLGSNPTMKTISNPFSHRVKRHHSPPLFIDKYLYWMLDPDNYEYNYSNRSDIMQFDILSEEFMVMPCPVPLDDTKFSSNNTMLLNIDGTLSFVLILPRKITIWRLEDHAQQLWTTVDYPLTVELYQGMEVPRAIAVVKGKLALLSEGRLTVYDLMQGMMYCHKTQYNDSVLFLSHQMSLASLMKCTSKISINQEGELARAEIFTDVDTEDEVPLNLGSEEEEDECLWIEFKS